MGPLQLPAVCSVDVIRQAGPANLPKKISVALPSWCCRARVRWDSSTSPFERAMWSALTAANGRQGPPFRDRPPSIHFARQGCQRILQYQRYPAQHGQLINRSKSFVSISAEPVLLNRTVLHTCLRSASSKPFCKIISEAPPSPSASACSSCTTYSQRLLCLTPRPACLY